MEPLSLQALKGTVLRLEGVVDRFGTFEQGRHTHHTLCIRNLRVASTGQPIKPDHWWFKLRANWCEAGVQAGDRILFTAKVASCSKGCHGSDRLGDRAVRPRERVIGFAGQVRDLVIARRSQEQHGLVNALEEQLRRQIQLQEEAQDHAQRLEVHRDALLRDLERLREQLNTWKTRCHILDPSLARSGMVVSHKARRRYKGFRECSLTKVFDLCAN